MYIVQGEEAQPEYLVRDEKVADVGSAESRASGAVAFRIEWSRIGAILGALDVQAPLAGEGGAISAHSSRSHAVEQVHASTNCFDQIFRESHSHQIARVRFWQRVVDDFDHLVHRVLFLADRESADSEAGPVVHRSDFICGLATQVGVNSSLQDWK